MSVATPSTPGHVVPSTKKCNRGKWYWEYVGEKFGMLEIIDFVPEHNGLIVAQCNCGSVNVFPIAGIRKGTRKSCGCHIPKSRPPSPNGFKMNRKLYWVWSTMKDRCNNPKNKKFQDYGGRGIQVCERWEESFENFLLDMGTRPTEDHTIERVNNFGDYEPKNCRWALRPEQMRNTRKNVFVSLKGKKMCLKDACSQLGIAESSIRRKVKSKSLSPQQCVDFFVAKLSQACSPSTP